MREIVDQLFQTGLEHEYGIGWCYFIVGNNGLILIDPGFGWHFKPSKGMKITQNGSLIRSESLITPNLMELLHFARSMKKQLKYGILTHGHADHTANMELLLHRTDDINTFFTEKIVDLQLIVHQNSSFRNPVFKRISTATQMELDGHKLQLIPTPGHSGTNDDLSIYLEDKKVLFCGDICQPQGRDYHVCEGPSPIPYFFNGDLGKKSLKLLMNFDFRILLTAHGFQYNRTDGLKALSLTHSLLDRIDQLALKLIREHPDENSSVLSLWIYDTITHERQFNREKAEFRKVHFDKNGVSDFQKYDQITINYFITKYLQEIKSVDGKDM